MFALIPFFLGSLNKNVSIWYEGVSCHSMSLDAILESWGGDNWVMQLREVRSDLCLHTGR